MAPNSSFITCTSPTHSNASHWNTSQVCLWLSQAGFERYVPNFVENKVTGRELLDLDEEDLIEALDILSEPDVKAILDLIQSVQ